MTPSSGSTGNCVAWSGSSLGGGPPGKGKVGRVWLCLVRMMGTVCGQGLRASFSLAASGSALKRPTAADLVSPALQLAVNFAR